MEQVGYFRFAWVFFFLAAGIGLMLRAFPFFPVPGIDYAHLLHAHSHLMFLGWVLNTLLLAFIFDVVPVERRKGVLVLFLVLQAALLGMAVSFPLQGYGLYSNIFSTVHTLVVMGVGVRVYRGIGQNQGPVAMNMAKASLFFFLLSTAGPMALPPIILSGEGHSPWYFFAVYYYLHFQYNGTFTFGVFYLFFRMLEDKGIAFNVVYARRFFYWLFWACIPAYSLSVLWAKPGWAVTGIGYVSGAMQGVALVYFLKMVMGIGQGWKKFSSTTVWILVVFGLAFGIKVLLQAVSAFPFVVQLVFENRNLVMAYLHLVLLGQISLGLVAWYLEQRKLSLSWAKAGLVFYLPGLLVNEGVLAFSPWFGGGMARAVPYWLLVTSVALVMGVFLLMVSAFSGQRPASKPRGHGAL